jgi:DNA-binding GntR family transcriptional regulator
MTTSTTVQMAFDNIRDRILAGELPPGTVISEAGLAKQLGVSRTPVGEALRELASVGLVEQVPRYGTIVRTVTRQEIVELYELREGLEPHAVALAASRISAADLERLEMLCQRIEGFLADLEQSQRNALDGQTLREFLAADMAFHTLLIFAAGNRRIARVVRDSHVMTELFGTHRIVHDRTIVAELCQFHAQILAAVRRGDAEAARSAAAAHVRTSLAHTLECLDRRPNSGSLSSLALPDDVRDELRRVESNLQPPQSPSAPDTPFPQTSPAKSRTSVRRKPRS